MIWNTCWCICVRWSGRGRVGTPGELWRSESVFMLNVAETVGQTRDEPSR